MDKQRRERSGVGLTGAGAGSTGENSTGRCDIAPAPTGTFPPPVRSTTVAATGDLDGSRAKRISGAQRRMRAVLQRVSRASVEVEGAIVGQIDTGWLVLLGVTSGDRDDDAEALRTKPCTQRLRRHRGQTTGVYEACGILVVSQFTLLADCRAGRRPSFTAAAAPAEAERLYRRFVDRVRSHGITAATGVFRAMMNVSLVNDGPVTFVLDSRKAF